MLNSSDGGESVGPANVRRVRQLAPLLTILLLALAVPPGVAAAGEWQPSLHDLRITGIDSNVNDETSVVDLAGTIDRRLLDQGHLVIVRALFHLEQDCSSAADTITAHSDLGLGGYDLEVLQPDENEPGINLDWSAEVVTSPNLLPGYTNICPAGYAPSTGFVRVTGVRVIAYPGPFAPPLDRSGDPLVLILELPGGTFVSKGHVYAPLVRRAGVLSS